MIDGERPPRMERTSNRMSIENNFLPACLPETPDSFESQEPRRFRSSSSIRPSVRPSTFHHGQERGPMQQKKNPRSPRKPTRIVCQMMPSPVRGAKSSTSHPNSYKRSEERKTVSRCLSRLTAHPVACLGPSALSQLLQQQIAGASRICRNQGTAPPSACHTTTLATCEAEPIYRFCLSPLPYPRPTKPPLSAHRAAMIRSKVSVYCVWCFAGNRARAFSNKKGLFTRRVVRGVRPRHPVYEGINGK
jgi:hypothetical protein